MRFSSSIFEKPSESLLHSSAKDSLRVFWALVHFLYQILDLITQITAKLPNLSNIKETKNRSMLRNNILKTQKFKSRNSQPSHVLLMCSSILRIIPCICLKNSWFLNNSVSTFNLQQVVFNLRLVIHNSRF